MVFVRVFSEFISHVAGQSPFRRRSVFLGRTATEIVDSERIASQVSFFLQTCDDLFSDAVIPEDVVEDDFGVQEVCAEDGIDGREGTAKVFVHQV